MSETLDGSTEVLAEVKMFTQVALTVDQSRLATHGDQNRKLRKPSP